MSLWNHDLNWSDQAHALVNQVPNERGETSPPPADVPTFFDRWLHNGWLAWERDGWRFWSFLHNVVSWWDHHHQANILLLLDSDLKATFCRPRSPELPAFSHPQTRATPRHGACVFRQQPQGGRTVSLRGKPGGVARVPRRASCCPTG
jgi:hypothetical protein